MQQITKSRKLKKAGVTTQFIPSMVGASNPSLLCYLPFDSPLQIPMDKLSPPWDNACSGLQKLVIPMPPPNLSMTPDVYESLINRVIRARQKALQFWVAIHHVIAKGPGRGTYFAPTQESLDQGELFYRYLSLCQGAFSRIPKDSHDYVTASTWWTLCMLEWWTCQVSSELKKTRLRRSDAKAVQSDFYDFSKFLQQLPHETDRVEALNGSIPSTTVIHTRELLRMSGYLAGIDKVYLLFFSNTTVFIITHLFPYILFEPV
jgi:hypothetical protein